MKKELLTKIPKEVYAWLKEEGLIYSDYEENKTYCMIPFWFEMVDDEKYLVKEYNFKSLPKEVQEIHDDYLKLK